MLELVYHELCEICKEIAPPEALAAVAAWRGRGAGAGSHDDDR